MARIKKSDFYNTLCVYTIYCMFKSLKSATTLTSNDT